MIRAPLSRIPLRRSAAALSTQSAAVQAQLQRESAATNRPPPALRQRLQRDEEARNDLAYCLSFSNDESDFSRNMLQLFPDALMQDQLQNSLILSDSTKNHQQQTTIDQQPLPRTLEDALRPQKTRAIVVTEAVKPFRIVQVNAAWEDLCGYTFVQARNQTLGALVQGPDTDPVATTGLIAKLLAGEPEAAATLTNYTAAGRRFRNRVRVGPLFDDSSSNSLHHNRSVPTHFVGVLQEVHDGM